MGSPVIFAIISASNPSSFIFKAVDLSSFSIPCSIPSAKPSARLFFWQFP